MGISFFSSNQMVIPVDALTHSLTHITALDENTIMHIQLACFHGAFPCHFTDYASYYPLNSGCYSINSVCHHSNGSLQHNTQTLTAHAV